MGKTSQEGLGSGQSGNTLVPLLEYISFDGSPEGWSAEIRTLVEGVLINNGAEGEVLVSTSLAEAGILVDFIKVNFVCP
ncbi:hypothetical protein [Phaeodactylibacter luteus]|uniref:Uncharacterized protein n=1 Tax=Phaeodactylibacter luteus TaxID=1564516 RepID=A0A5C6REY0_9BACT|nr:hypothetical protein [Phaeodactylibacter luteus]TXB56171.1 hypothetical protein FRY97_21850 [Phaeodactylibacter luteus]